MYDAKIRTQRLQPVTIGRTLSGRWGLFTSGYMAWPLERHDVQRFIDNHPALHEYCRWRGFEWDGIWSVSNEDFPFDAL